jgi:hypothetical protein
MVRSTCRVGRTFAAVLILTALAAGAFAAEPPGTAQPGGQGSGSLEQRVRQLEELVGKLQGEGKAVPAEAEGVPTGEKPRNLFAPLSERIEITGEVRVRGEYRSVVDYKTDSGIDGDTSFTLLRTRLTVDAKVNDWLRGYVQFQDSRTFGEEFSTTADNRSSFDNHDTGTDLHQGYFDARLDGFLGGLPLTLRAGRQEIQLGSGRLVDTCAWGNSGRSFDGIRLILAGDPWAINVFGATIKEPYYAAGTRSHTDEDQLFGGLHVTYTGIEKHTLDLYAYGRDFADNSFRGEDHPAESGDRKDLTCGARVLGRLGPVDYEGEAAGQAGRYAYDDELACMVVGRLGYNFDSVSWKPRLGLEYDFASGDEDPADGERGGFDDMYGLRHLVLGFADYTGRSNLHAFMAQAGMKPFKDWTVGVDYHYFLLAEKKDAWRASDLSVMRRDPAGKSGDELGSEIDLQAAYKTKNFDLCFGGALFLVGDYVRETTDREKDAIWLFMSAAVKF